ncbi:MAG TPA: hypothetical protein VHO06_22935 [Polyangia bacterium]|nr:hypothetical protein [Polyangia bacterium]
MNKDSEGLTARKDAKYEAPVLIALGNLHDLLAETGGSQCDVDAISSAVPDHSPGCS